MNSFTCEIKKNDAGRIKKDLSERGFLFKDLPYGYFSAVHKQLHVNVNVFHSNKCLVQGKGTEDFVRYYLEPEILKTFDLDYGHLSYEEKIGMDEAGKGDYFGPLVVASVFVDTENYLRFKKLGIRDSKKMDDKTVIRVSGIIRQHAPVKTVLIGPEKYNQLYASFGNLNSLLSWAHAACLKNLWLTCKAPRALLDQFGSPWKIKLQLKKMGVTIPLETKTHGESDMAVACASVMARSVFLTELQALSDEYQIDFPKGAGEPTHSKAKSFIEKYGRENFGKVAKLHFKNTEKIK
ncbi:MAG: ribonuclease HIII [Candidatus Aureabacteria bacterium]|nr:ribonuclease HIII [Candidatus Auribacterota bacterium]